MEDAVIWKVARTLWAIRILYVCGDRKDYNDRLTAVENFGLQNGLAPDTYLVRAAKALAKKGEEGNVLRFTDPKLLKSMQATGVYLRCLMYRDQRTASGLQQFAQQFENLRQSRPPKGPNRRLVAASIFKKLEGDLCFLKAVHLISPLPLGTTAVQSQNRENDPVFAADYINQAIRAYRQALKDWKIRPGLEYCIPLSAAEGDYIYDSENLSNAFVAVVKYHIGLAFAWGGGFTEASKWLSQSASLAKNQSDEPSSWLLPYLLAVVLRDQATVELLSKLYPQRQPIPWTFADLAILTPQSLEPALRDYEGHLKDAIKAADEAAIRFNYSFDSHPICSAKYDVTQKYISTVKSAKLRESDLTVLAWLPHPGHSGSMYDPECTDLIAALVSIDKDQYLKAMLPEDEGQLLPDAFRKYGNTQTAGETNPNSIGPFVFSALRDWASSVPLLRSFSPRLRNLGGGKAIAARGGGYVLSCGPDSFVVDPGYDFVANYTEQGFNLGAVRAVFVSHDHPDHNSDLTRLDDLIYEFRRRIPKLETVKPSEPRPRLRPSTRLPARSTEPRLHLYLDTSTTVAWAKRCESLLPMNDSILDDTHVYEITNSSEAGPMTMRLLKGDTLRRTGDTRGDTRGKVDYGDYTEVPQLVIYRSDPAGEEGRRITVNAKWWEVSHTIGGAMGFSFDCVQDSAPGEPSERLWKLGYSGDCRFDESLIADDGPFHGCDVVLLHLSQPDLGELVSEGRFLKPDHLGFYGALRIAIGLRPRPSIVILGEFWGGRGDLRLTISLEFSRLLNEGRDSADPDFVVVLPASQGLHLDLEKRRILCNYCFGEWSEARSVEPVRSTGPYSGYYYLCHRCRAQVSRSVTRA